KLLDDPPSLGLCRVHDADGQFYGFFAEVPERNSTEHLTTMRANCISCHSEVLYGASTIFSLCRRSPAKPRSTITEGGHLSRMSDAGWLVKEEGLQTIQQCLLSRLGVKSEIQNSKSETNPKSQIPKEETNLISILR